MAAECSSDIASQKNQSRPSNLCCYSQRVCNLEKLKGFDFCHKHILEDKASPFKPCDFYAKSNERRCMNPAPKLHDKEKSYCIIHTRKAELRRAVEKRRKKQRRDSNAVEEDEEESTIEKRRRTSSSASQKSIDGSQKEDEGHSSDDEIGMELGIGGTLKVDSAWHGDVDSDAESVDSEEEDVLRHAGVWTLEESSNICCEKMIRLKSLYVAQYKRLFHVLKEKRRKYLQVIQAEQENGSGECLLNPSEILRSPAHNKRHGVEAILHKQAKEKRHGTRHQSTSHQRCTHVADGMRCPNRILPLTKYCIHHISHDPNQLLFQSCSFKTGDQKTCTNMVPKIYPFSVCQLHITLPAEPTRTDIMKDLEMAKKRDEEKRASEKRTKKDTVKAIPSIQVTDKQLPIPKALQQKSSALIPPPLAPVTMETSHTQETPPTIKVSPVPSLDMKPSTLKNEKMDAHPCLEGLLPKSGASSGSTPKEILSPASVDSPAGVQNISPTLLAASLAAVCSEAAAPKVTSPLATLSPPSDKIIFAPSSEAKSTPVSSVSYGSSVVSCTAASIASTLSTTAITTLTTTTDPSTTNSSSPSGLSSVTSSDRSSPKDCDVAPSLASLVKGDLPQPTIHSDDIKSKDDETSMIATELPSNSDSKANNITTTMSKTETNATSENMPEFQGSSMKIGYYASGSPNTESYSLETDSIKKAEALTNTSTKSSEGSVSVADQNPTTAATILNVSTPQPCSMSRSSDTMPETS